jgi:hypothetical protein
LAENLDSLRTKNDAVAEIYVTFGYKTVEGREFATHGFLRRLRMLVHCVERVFDLLPPEQERLPEDDILFDATLYIQSFIMNVFGALDNLVWIWVNEKQLPIGKNKVGLGPKCVAVRNSFSSEMRDYLASLENWFEHLADFRDSLAHRIPLYIPPYCVPDIHQDAYTKLSVEKFATQDHDEYLRLKNEQLKLVVYQPVMKHTLNDTKPPVVFHFQLLQDFATVEEIGRKILTELRKP